MTQKDIELICKYLEKTYPISRVKHNTRFRRGILFDDGRTYILGDKLQLTTLKFKLIESLKFIFLCDETTCHLVVDNLLKTK